MADKTYGNKPVPFPPEIAHNPKRKPIVSSVRPPLVQSAWNSSQLSTKPFWETSNINSATSSQQQQQHDNTTVSPPSPPLVPYSREAPSSTAAPSQPSPIPSPHSSTPTVPSSMTRQQRKSLGSYASKYATQPPPSSDSATLTSPPTFTLSPTNSSSNSLPKSVQADHNITTTTEPPVISATISLADLLMPPTPPERTPFFVLDIELIPGVSTLLPVYETDDYTSLVKQFAAKHHLSFAPEAERTFAKKIQQMATELNK